MKLTGKESADLLIARKMQEQADTIIELEAANLEYEKTTGFVKTINNLMDENSRLLAKNKELEIMCRDLAYAEQEAVKKHTALHLEIDELHARIELALRINSDPVLPGYVGEALRGRKLEDMPVIVQAMLDENNL